MQNQNSCASRAADYLRRSELPLIVLPELAKEIGLEEAIIFRHLHWLLADERNGKIVNGKRWLFNTYEQWVEHFPWLNARTISRYLVKLEKMGLVESCQPEGGISRRKYYRVTIGAVGGHATK